MNKMQILDKFGRPMMGPGSVKHSEAGPLIYLMQLGRESWQPKDYKKYAEEAFQQNPVAYRCVRMVAESVGSIDFLLYNGEEEIADHPVLDLLDRPNPFVTGSDLIEGWVISLQLSGNGWMEYADNSARPELWLLRPDRMFADLGPKGNFVQYRYKTAQGERIWPIDFNGRSKVWHQRMYHPTNDQYGLAAVEPAASSIDRHNEAAAFNRALIANSMRPSGALVYKGESGNDTLTDEQFTRLKRDMEDQYQGSANAGRPLLLEGGLDWKPMGMTPQDMEQTESSNQAARNIALAFGVPPMLLGIPGDNTFSNFREANLTFWRQTVLPIVTKLCRGLTNWLAPMMDAEGLRVWFDADVIEALSLDRERLYDRLGKADFLTINEKREAAGYEPVEGGDQIMAPATSLPLGLTESLFGNAGAGEPVKPDPERKPGTQDGQDG